MSNHPCHSKNLKSLKRIEGQVRGIQKMIEEGKYCVDIIHQVHAVVGALVSVENAILEAHLNSCVSNALSEGSVQDKEQKLNEVMGLIRQSRKGYR